MTNNTAVTMRIDAFDFLSPTFDQSIRFLEKFCSLGFSEVSKFRYGLLVVKELGPIKRDL